MRNEAADSFFLISGSISVEFVNITFAGFHATGSISGVSSTEQLLVGGTPGCFLPRRYLHFLFHRDSHERHRTSTCWSSFSAAVAECVAGDKLRKNLASLFDIVQLHPKLCVIHELL